jgi:insulysin
MLYHLLCFLYLLSSTLSADEPAPYTVVEDQATLPLLTVGASERQTAKLILNNGLQVYLVSDPIADTSGAALSVQAGCWNDPTDAPGVAHFLEHMLFLGTEKYPSESEFHSFGKEHNGTMNAYTTTDHTCFMFSISHAAFPEGLDRFSQFFQHPLFNPSGVSRELNAIDQEHAKNLINDKRRLFAVLQELTNPKHPFHQFSTGNKETLSNVSQQTLRNWYESHYSANLMHLVVYSALPLDTLKGMVVENFQGIKNKNLQRFHTDTPLFLPEHKGLFVQINSLKDIHTLSLLWELPPSLIKMRESQPDMIAGHLLGNEDEHSLLAVLKRENLAKEICAGAIPLNPDTALFAIQIELTSLGASKKEAVIEKCFEAIALFQEKELPEYLFHDLKQLAKIHYQYQPRVDTYQKVSDLARIMPQENLATFPEHSSIIQAFNPQAVKELFNHLKPETAIVTLMSQGAVSPSESGKSFRKEKWMGVEYAVTPLLEEEVAKWQEALPAVDITLPAPNLFIPEHLALLNQSETTLVKSSGILQPTVAVDDPSMKIYTAPDCCFQEPKATWFFEIKTPQIDAGNAAKVVLGELYIKRLKEDLSAIVYPASAAGLNYEIALTDNGLVIAVSGYSEHAPLLFDEILKRLKNITLSEHSFKMDKEALKMGYANGAKESSLEQSFEILRNVLTNDFVTKKQKTIAIRKVTFPKFKEFVEELYASTYTLGLLYGNTPASQTRSLAEKLQSTLKSATYPVNKHKQTKTLLLPEKKGPHSLSPNIKTTSNTALLAIQQRPFSFKLEAAQKIIANAIESDFYAELRTKQQTGYLVHSLPLNLKNNLFQLFAVQSNTHDTTDLLARFELFLEGFLQELTTKSISEERFKKMKAASLLALEQTPQNVSEMGALLKEIAFKHDGDFELVTKKIQGLKELTYDECIEAAKAWFGKSNKRRLAILIKGNLPDENQFTYQPLKSVVEVKKISSYKGK